MILRSSATASISSFVALLLLDIFHSLLVVHSELVTIEKIPLCCQDFNDWDSCISNIYQNNPTSNLSVIFLPTSIVSTNNASSSANISNNRIFELSLKDSLNCTLEEERYLSIPRSSNDFDKYPTGIQLSSEDGSLTYRGENYLHSEYCIGQITLELIYLRFCKLKDNFSEPETSPISIRKCCPQDEIYDLQSYGKESIKCVPSLYSSWEPQLYSDAHIKVRLNHTEFSTNDIQFIPNPKGWCRTNSKFKVLRSQRSIFNEKRSLFRILSNGTLLYKEHYRIWSKLTPGTFCLEFGTNFPGHESSSNETDEKDLIIIQCESFSEHEPEDSVSENMGVKKRIVYGILQSIACFFLILTVLAYASLWDKQNIHSWTLLGYALAMLCWYSSLLLTYITYNETSAEFHIFCKILGVTTHFFLISTFAWMTLINFDVWSTFKSLRLSNKKEKQWKRFLAYVAFGLGVPFIVILIGLLLDYFYKDDIESEIIRPQYGGLKCFIDFEYAILPFVYAPVAILMICNLIFFVITIYTLYKIRESTKIATSTTQSSNSANTSLLLFTKLFFVMGISWTCELVFFFVFLNDQSNPLGLIVDILHDLQPIAIFVIFVCKKEVSRGLKLKYPCYKRLCGIFFTRKANLRLSANSVQTDETQISSCSTRSMSIGTLGSIYLHTISMKANSPISP